MFDINGNLLGIVVGSHDYTDGIGLCVPANVITSVLNNEKSKDIIPVE